MNHHELFKHNLSFQKKIILQYIEEAENFQCQHNLTHPDQRIWKHRYDLRTFYFFDHGSFLYAQVRILRFRFAGTNRTFTFYGSLFCAFSHFAKTFMSQAVAQADVLLGELSTLVSIQTLSRWASLLSADPSPAASAGGIPQKPDGRPRPAFE